MEKITIQPKERNKIMSTELVKIDELNAIEVFTKNGLDPILEKIEKDARSIDRDISTPAGRDNIRTIAHRIAKSKTAIDKLGKNLGEDLRTQLNSINSERKRGVDRLQALQDEIRAPLTEFEEREKKRVETHEKALAEIESLSDLNEALSTDQIQKKIDILPDLMKRDWQEFSDRAEAARGLCHERLTAYHTAAKKREDEAAELARLRAEKEAQERKAREEKIAAEAAEKARLEAEEKAAAAIKAEQDRLAAAEKKAADDAAAAAKALKDAQEKAERDKQAALKKQADDAAAAKRAEEEAAAKRAADQEHKKKINNEALNCIKAVIDEAAAQEGDLAQMIVVAIAKGLITHVSIKY
jgi:DNA repair exonuclease SbcCD ATPase subunit